MTEAVLYIFSGLPASGKSTLAKELARHIGVTYLRIDTLEQGLRDICGMRDIEGEGYMLSHLLAKDNLMAGNSVIADSVNPWELTRKGWNDVAISSGAKYVNIEVSCSDSAEHRYRLENRDVGIKNLKMPTWEQVKNRDYHPWTMPRICIDTAGRTVVESLEELISKLDIGKKQ
ncbi:MAG: AAA family ATPase [Alphaproteobacteria bacterium]|nr:AAA family ATPase [Alphaproteobacteria bacterium]